MAVVANTVQHWKMHTRGDGGVVQTANQEMLPADAVKNGEPLPGVAGSLIVATIGKGGFGDVKLVKEANGDQFAVKIMSAKKLKEAGFPITNEVQLHCQMDHERIVNFIRHFSILDKEFICLEYVTGGDLYAKIKAQDGIDEGESRRIFRQLMEGVNYMHHEGIVHRDIKPENVLLDCAENVKITDFGFAVRFRIDGTVRMLHRRCGSRGYCAPEVFFDDVYHATPIDIWSCAIVLVAMFSGGIPWSFPDGSAFSEFFNRKDFPWEPQRFPWTMVGQLPMQLIRHMLVIAPLQRASAEDVLKSDWLCRRRSSRLRKGPAPKRIRR